MKFYSLDTETTGLDFWHGCRAYAVSISDGENQLLWEWPVCVHSRMPQYNEWDLREISDLLSDKDTRWFMHNAKFDVRALEFAGVSIPSDLWGRIDDTVVAGHLVNSNESHELGYLVMKYLRVDLDPYEKRLMKPLKTALGIVKRCYPGWSIMRPGDERYPSAWSGDPPKMKTGSTKADAWVLERLADAEGYPETHPYRRVLGEYADADSLSTYHLGMVQRGILEDRGLGGIYRERMLQLPVIYDMESNGITVSRKRMTAMGIKFSEVMDECSDICRRISGGELQSLPIGRSKLLETVLFDRLGLKTERKTAKGGRSLDKFVLEDWMIELEDTSEAYRFVDSFRRFKKRSTAVSYLKSYKKFMVYSDGVHRMHPSVHMTGTGTLRTSSRNPNEQQISQQEEANVREGFGPTQGREWWSFDYENIELRIPAYESGERDLIDLFERSSEPPYYGSEHLLNFSIVYPDIWGMIVGKVGVDKAGPWIKENYKATWYKWVKSGDFAVGYGAIEKTEEQGIGTADKVFRRPGSHARLKAKFQAKEKLNQWCIETANRLGYIETLPDREIDPSRGYPLICPRGDRGRISPTIPLNYRVQGTACWVIRRATVKVNEYLRTLSGYYLIMDVHDELVVDMPFRTDRGNQVIADRVVSIMESMGDAIGVPLKVGASYHPKMWSRSE